jgi:hypothetical protein
VVALQLLSRGRAYPFEDAHFDFWPIRMESRGTFVVGVDFSKAMGGRPPAPERFVEVVGLIWRPRSCGQSATPR